MGESAGDEQLTVIFAREFHGDVASEGGRSAADVHRDVEHRARDHAHQLGLRGGPVLEMKSPYHAVTRFRFVVLHEIHGPRNLLETLSGEALEEIAPGVAEQVGFEDQHPFDVGSVYFHLCSSMSLRRYCPYWFLSIGPASSRTLSAVIQPLR